MLEETYLRLMQEIQQMTPCRERSLAITKLQEVHFWALEAMTTSEKKEEKK